MMISSRQFKTFLTFAAILAVFTTGRADDFLSVQAGSSNSIDGFNHFIPITSTVSGTMMDGYTGIHGSGTATITYGSIDFAVHSVSGDSGAGGGYATGKSGDSDMWNEMLTITPDNGELNGTGGVAQFTFAFNGTFTEHNNITSSSSNWGILLPSGNNYSYSTIGGGSQIGDVPHTIVDNVSFTYGVPFQVQVSMYAYANTNQSSNASVDAVMSLRLTGFTVTSSGTPTDYTATTHSGNSAQKSVASEGSYAGFTLTNTAPGAIGSTITLLEGNASADKVLAATFSAAPAGSPTLASDVVNFSGTVTDKYVLQLSYDPATAIAQFGSESNAVLLWYDPTSQTWVNAILGNSDGGAQSQHILGAYVEGTDFVLGDYGVDVDNHVVWAVIDHNSTFGVGGIEAVPEPSSVAMLFSSAGLVFVARRRRRRQRP